MKTLLLCLLFAVNSLAQVTSIPAVTGAGGGPSVGAADTPQCSDGAGGFVECPPGTYAADVASSDPWTISGATHGLESCDVSVTTQTESAGVRTWVIPAGWTCDEATFDISIDFASATAGRVAILKNGGGGGGGGSGAPTDAPYWLSTSNGTLSAEVNLGALADNSIVAVDVTAGTATPRAAVYTDVVPLWDAGACGTDYLRGNGTCDTPAGALPAATPYQVYRRNSDDTADEAATVTAGAGITVTPSSGQITISSDCAQVACLAQNNAFNGNNAYAGTTTQTPSATQTLVAGDAITVSTITFKSITASSAITLTSTPTIADGTAGQELILVNEGATNSITIQDETNLAGSNLCLPADTNITLASGDAVRMVFSSTRSCWIAFR